MNIWFGSAMKPAPGFMFMFMPRFMSMPTMLLGMFMLGMPFAMAFGIVLGMDADTAGSIDTPFIGSDASDAGNGIASIDAVVDDDMEAEPAVALPDEAVGEFSSSGKSIIPADEDPEFPPASALASSIIMLPLKSRPLPPRSMPPVPPKLSWFK